MREYGQLQCSFWQRACEEGWSNDAKLLGAYLVTGPHSNGIGCYRLPIGYISDDLGWDKKTVEETLSELFRNGFCNRFGQVVFVPKFLRWNRIPNPNVAKHRQEEFYAVPNDEAKLHLSVVLLEHCDQWTEGFRNHLETLSERFFQKLGNRRGEERRGEEDTLAGEGSTLASTVGGAK